MGDPRSTTPVRLTVLHENMLYRAYKQEDHRILGGAPRTRETLVHFKYATRTGINGSGYEEHVLTPKGIDRAKSIAEARESSRPKETNKNRANAGLLNDLLAALIDPNVGSKTFVLPNGDRIRLDRSGPTKLIVQVTPSKR